MKFRKMNGLERNKAAIAYVLVPGKMSETASNVDRGIWLEGA